MPEALHSTAGWGLIAGNGRFPFLVLEGARSQGIEMAVIALKEEASPELEKIAKRLHWVSLGELSKAITLMQQEGVNRAVMAGPGKAQQDFQRHPAGLEIGQAVVFVAKEEYGLADWSGGESVSKRKESSWWTRQCS